MAVTKLQTRMTFVVTDKGAVGNGVAYDTTAIQDTIDACVAAGGGTVFFPEGTYLITLADLIRALRIYPNVVLQGAPGGVSIIKLADAQGSYKYIMAPDPVDADMTGFGMFDLVIDQNTTNNSGTPNTTTDTRVVVNIFAGSRIYIERCRFIDLNNTNTIVANGVTVEDVSILNNTFAVTGDASSHDHSTIYFNGEGALIAGNTFRGGTPGQFSILTAIEMHGSGYIVAHNRVSDFLCGANITGTSQVSSNVIAAFNTFEQVRCGIQLWSNTGTPLTNAVIAHNTVRVSPSVWDTFTRAILLEPNSTAGVRNVHIHDNVLQLVGALGTTSASDNQGGGVEWWRNGGSAIDENLSIISNTVDGTMGAGIRIGASVRGLQIKNNTIRNPGLSGGGFANDYRAGIVLTGPTISDADIAGNIILDDQATSTIKYGIRNAATTLENIHVRCNPLRVNDGTVIAEYSENVAKAGVYVELARGGTIVRTFTAADTTPSVKDGKVFATANVGATTITTFDDGVEGQQITVKLDANTTLQDGASLQLAGGANLTGTANDIIRLVNIAGVWYEVSRSVN